MKNLTRLLKSYMKTKPYSLKGFIPIMKEIDTIDFCLQGKYPSHTNSDSIHFILKESDNWQIKLINWSPGATSQIHNHPNGGCILMPMSGNLIEKTYNGSKVETNELLKHSIYYADGEDYYHKIINPRRFLNISSLHIYFEK